MSLSGHTRIRTLLVTGASAPRCRFEEAEDVQVERAEGLEDAVARVSEGRAALDLVLVDLTSLDMPPALAIAPIHAVAGPLPIVAMLALEGEAAGIEAIRAGAVDFVFASSADTTGEIVARMRYAVERGRVIARGRELERRL